eukprot:m.85814 g.85814  ORF g.85814 m.85814 type:complete len:112 (-) comp14739_c0_seq1:1656-1991(-)
MRLLYTGTGVNRYTDNLKVCCVPRKLKYDANVRCQLPTPNDTAFHVYFSTCTSGTSVQHDYAISPDGDGACRVVDSVVIDAPWLLRGYVRRTAFAAHSQMMERLPAAVVDG